MLFEATGTDLDIITLSDINQRQVLYHTAYMQNLKLTYSHNRKRLIDTENKLMVTTGESRVGEGINQDVGINIYTLVDIK